MAWRLKIYFTDGTSELVDDLFDSEEAAQDEYDMWLDSWSSGGEVLMDAGRGYFDNGIDYCEIWEE